MEYRIADIRQLPGMPKAFAVRRRKSGRWSDIFRRKQKNVLF